MFDDVYKTIAQPSEGIFKDKGSKFIALLYPVASEEEVKTILAAVKKKYYSATHHCYAYTIGHTASPVFRLNDDGEPSGTAGRPIYGQLLSHDLKNTLAIVVRYFGGTKLGVSGLINAYKAACKTAIENSEIIEKTIMELYRVYFDYAKTNAVMQVLKKEGINIKDNSYDNNLSVVEFEVVRSKSDYIFGELRKIEETKITHLKTI